MNSNQAFVLTVDVGKKRRILLVEDDPSIQILTAAILKSQFTVIPVESVAQAQAVLASDNIDLVLLDIGLPDEDGTVFARQIRSRGPDPAIIFVTSRDSTLDKVEGLNIGADDFVTKPFDPEELIARINSVLRRSRGDYSSGKGNTRIRVGYIEVDLSSRQVWTAAGDIAPLTKAEFDVFIALVNGNGAILERRQLLDAISTSPDHDAQEKTIDTIVSRIRKKISSREDKEHVIVTVQGIGYRLGVVRS